MKNIPITEDNKNGRRRNETSANHSLKKFAITQMAKSKVDLEIRRKLTDHSIGDVT